MPDTGAFGSGAADRRPHSHFGFWALLAWLIITLMWWALAFAPLPRPPAWLADAREVCFGTLPSGLPEPWGWGSLIVTPLAMLGFLLAISGGELKRDLVRLAHLPAGRVLLVVMATIPLLGAGWVAARVVEARALSRSLTARVDSDDLPPSYPRGDRPAPGLELVDQRGAEFSLAALSGRPVLLTFAFAHCRTVCPIVVETVRGAAAEIAELSPAVVVVTLDPWRDTPASLPSLARDWRLDELPGAHVLSGEIDQVLAVHDAWEMRIERNLQDGDIAHPATVHVVDPDGRLAYTFLNPPPAQVAEAARRTTVTARSVTSQGPAP